VNVYVDGDGLNELIVAYADRVVRAYRWSAADDSSVVGKSLASNATLVAVDKWLLTGQVSHTSYRLTDSFWEDGNSGSIFLPLPVHLIKYFIWA